MKKVAIAADMVVVAVAAAVEAVAFVVALFI